MVRINIMLTLKQIIEMNEDGAKFLAVGSNGRKYNAIYDAEFKVMFFTIPSEVKILGYERV